MPYALQVTSPGNKKLSLSEIEIPPLDSNEILIEVEVAAQNPVDWKQVDRVEGLPAQLPSYPATNGGDVSGTVLDVGTGVDSFQKGDRVVAYLERKTARHAGYQTHAIAEKVAIAKIPDSLSFEDAATLPLAYATAAASLFHYLPLSLPSPSALPSPARDDWLLIWGGSSSVGSYAVQLGKLAGYRVVATASPSSHALLRELGAEAVVDYHDKDVVEKIKKITGDQLRFGFDAISEYGSIESTASSLSISHGGRATFTLPVPSSVQSAHPLTHLSVGGGKGVREDPAFGRRAFDLLEVLLEKRLLRTNKVRVMPGGLRGVEAGFELGRKHEISGEKLVYRVKETEGI